MTFPFDLKLSLVVVRAKLFGPSGSALLRLALDTGATSTLVDAGMLVALGYDTALSSRRIQVTTGSSVEYVPQILLRQIESLGQTRRRMTVLAHTLPPSSSVDDLLGLDFFRGKKLAIDFTTGRIEVR